MIDSISTRNISTPNTPTPTPDGLTFIPNPKMKKQKTLKVQLSYKINKKSEEEKICFEKIEEYKNLFNEGKFEELEDLIDSCNKDSPLSEYKFNAFINSFS